MSEGSITRKKRIWYYLPYFPAFAFTCEVVAVGVWDTNSRASLSAIKATLDILGLQLETQLVWGTAALAATVAFTIVLAVGMLGLGIGRCMLAYTADRTGATRMGGRLIAWLWACAAFVVAWFMVTLWLLVLLLGECVWLAGAWALNVAIKVGSAAAQYSRDNGLANTTISYQTEPASPCALGCVDLAAFEWALGSRTCFCELEVVAEADAKMLAAVGHMRGSAVGALLMLVSAIWILMGSAAEFGITRRERQLLRRIAKARLAASGEATKLLQGSAGSGPGKKGGKKGAAAGQPTDMVLVDPETGEVIDLGLTAADAAGTGSRSSPNAPGRGRAGSGAAYGSSGGSGSGSSLFKGVTRGISKGFAMPGKMLEAMGSMFTPRMR